MPFAGIQIDLKEQTLRSPNFSLLKLAVTATNKGYSWTRPPSVAGESLHRVSSVLLRCFLWTFGLTDLTSRY